ncbi:MAG TPA: hypothetical protein DD979_03460 [Gammaproteobacteria bacterium]|jgi:hypothetical protein|nr:hypothetical protein [Gammaproteobacteria bacterium]
MKKLLAALTLFVASFTANGAGLDLALSDETANLALLFNPGGDAVSNSQISLGAMFNDLDDLVFYGTLMALGASKYEEKYLSLGAGVRIYAGDLDELDHTVGALAIGGRAGIYVLPHPVNPVDVVLEGFFAPGITSTGDTEKMWEYSARLQVEVVRSARAYLGFRQVRVDVDDVGKVDVDDNFHLGISIDFY